MWFRSYKDYPIDKSLRNQKVESGRGIVGCEMQDVMGWGESDHRRERSRPGLLRTVLAVIFGGKLEEEE